MGPVVFFRLSEPMEGRREEWPHLNLLKPGVHMRGHHIFGYISTVIHFPQPGPCDCVFRRLTQISAQVSRG